jgi:glycosyltransferase involved in cell wall biosynthesis
VARRRSRICQLTPNLWSGGTEERIARVLSGLDRSDFELSWLGFGPVREALVERAGPGIEVVPIARDVAGGIELSLIAKLAARLRHLQPDVMHIHNWSTSLYGIAAARLAGVPMVLFGLGGQDSTDPPPRKRLAAMRALAPHVDIFTAVCRYLGQEIAMYWDVPSERIEVLPTGIDLDEVDRAPSKVEVRRSIGIPDDARVIGAISVFRPVKRIPDLIDAAGLLSETHPNLHLLLVGNAVGVSPEELRARAADRGLQGRFHLLGRVERPAWTLPAFDVFVNCSLFEGSSNAIIEAMAARIPVVATRVGGTPELLEHERHGYLVEPADVAGLARALDRLLSHPDVGLSYGRAGRLRVESTHSRASMSRAYLDLYSRCAARAHQAPGHGSSRIVRDLLTSLRKAASVT